MESGIYKWTSPSGKIYIGLAMDLARRKKEFLTNPHNYVYTSYDSAIDRARRKYDDFNAWEYEVITTSTKEELAELEMYYINQYNSTDSSVGYNATLGGDGAKGVKWGSQKQIEAAKKKNVRGENNPMYGKHHTEEVKKYISELNSGRKWTEHQKTVLCKPIEQYSKDGLFIKKWDSAASVMRELGIDKGSIGKVCMGKVKTAGGFIWKYAS